MTKDERKSKLSSDISDLMNEAILSGELTGEDISTVLEFKLECTRIANKVILKLGDELSKATGKKRFSEDAQLVIVGESKGQA